MHEFVVYRHRATEKRRIDRGVGHQADDAGEAATADATDAQIGDAHLSSARTEPPGISIFQVPNAKRRSCALRRANA